MRTYKVGVCDRDIDYSRALMEYVNSDTSLGFQIVIFSSIEHLILYLETKKLDLIITDNISGCERRGNELYLSDTKVLEMSETYLADKSYSITQSYRYRWR